MTATSSPNPAYDRSNRAKVKAAWLDLDPLAYYPPHNPPEPGRSLVLRPYRLNAQSQHERMTVPLDWLCEQVNAGVPKRVIGQDVRFEMGTQPRGV